MRDVETRLQRLERILEFSCELTSTVSLEPLLHKIVEAAAELTYSEMAAILLLDERTGELRFVTTSNLVDQLLDIPVPIEGSVAGAALSSGKPLIVSDACTDPRHYKAVGQLIGIETRSLLAAPLQFKDRRIGVLEAGNKYGDEEFDQEDVETLTALAAQATVAIENARLVEALRDVVRERQASYILLDTAKALSATLRLDKLLERVLDELQRVVPYDAASISMLRDERCWTIASRGLRHISAKRFVLEERPLVRRVVRERGPVIVPDVHEEPDWIPIAGLGPVRSWLGVPLTTKGEVIGVLMIDSHHPHTYDEEAARLAFAFAHQVALAIENSRLYEQVQAKLRETTLLHSVTTALSSTLDLDLMLPYVARSLCEILNCTSVEIYGLDEEDARPLRSATVAAIADYVTPESTKAEKERCSGQDRTHALADLPATAEALAQRRPMQARADDPKVDPHLQARLKARGAQATLLLPMVAGDRVLGFVQVWESKTPRHFTAGEIAMGQTVIHQAAITIDNARLVEALRQRTVELQARNEELDAFAHTVAHDLKTPLTSLIGFGNLLEQRFTEMPEEELRDNLQMIVQSGHKMSTIIGELLLLTSVRKMKEIEMAPLDMAGIVVETRARLTDLIEKHQAEITVMEDWPVALGRSPWVEEVWANYMSNAIKYGGRPLRVDLGATEQEDGSIRFWVRDNGPGLTPEEQARLFTPFTRLDQVRAKGHGLGLSIVRRIVEKMDGQVGVESTPGQGSVFFFTLPGAVQ